MFIADVMPVNKFEKIEEYILFNDTDAFIPLDLTVHHKLHKCFSVASKQRLSIDEKIFSTKVRHYMKQYMLMKLGFQVLYISRYL